MATSDVSKGAAELGMGQSPARRNLGLIGQYGSLGLLSLLVLGPIALTVIQALSPPFTYVNEGKPLHPVAVSWQDRTWFTGGPISLIVRTLIVVALLAWLQKVASGGGWKDGALRAPSRLVAIIGGTVVLALAMNPLFQSFFKADGNTLMIYVGAVLAVAATQVWGFLSPTRSPITSVVMALFTGFGLISFCVLTMGPTVWTLAWTRYDLGPAMGRSFVMAILITVLQVATAIMAAYAFVFLRFPFKRILFALFMATLLLPIEVTLVGNVATIRQLEWTDTMQALVLPFGAAALGTFLIRQGFRGLPSEIQDATRLDGYGHWAFLTKFAVPLTRPVIAAFTVISALAAWNQYLWPRSVITQNSFNTLQIQLRLASASEVANANQAIAAALVAAVPVVLLLIAFQRQIIRGLTAGAVK
ncbi:MAG TPA: carbohydrate ABC transporter permease [Acidimicrobiales bacterium]|jgi:sn-glycerol 3-phosphate transport system permease protein|nr:carbohydrate ABC transporter permease [Acidimicrobiales bacterium]